MAEATGEDQAASLKQLQEAMAAMQAELSATKAENAQLRRRSSSTKTRSPATPVSGGGAAAAGAGAGSGSGGGGSGARSKRVRAPSSRLYNPVKLQQKAEKLAKAKEEAELAKCSFRPKTKQSAGATSPKARGTSASNRLFLQAKRHQERRSKLSSQKGDLEVQDCTFSPAIDERSVKIATTADAANVDTFARLAVPRKHQSSETVNGGLDDKDLLECTFTPKLINPQRSVKKNQAAAHHRLYAEAILRQSKRDAVRKAKEEQERAQELDGCTFTPEVNVKEEYVKSAHAASVVERLYEKDVEQRTAKLKMLKKEVAKAFTFQPKVSKNAQYQTSNGSVIERLYETARVQREDDHPLDAECTFSPQITSLASKIDRGDLPTHERLALEMSPSQKIALADMEDYYEDDDEYYGDEYYDEEEEEGEEEEEEEGEEEDEEEEEGEMEEIDEEEDEEDLDLP